MKNNTLRAAVLGTGFMAQTHARHLLTLPGVALVAACGTSRQKAAAFLENAGVSDAAAHDDWNVLLGREKIDMAFICLPPFAHSGQVERAAEAGAALFLEKPLALTPSAAAAQVAAIEKAGVVSQVGYHLRFRKSVRRMMELMDSGRAGRPTQFLGRYWCRMDGSAWWRSANGSGGQVYEQAIHLYDLSLRFLGTPQCVWGQTANLCHADIPDYTIEDTALGMTRFTNGALASVASSNCALEGHFIGDFRLVCEKAVLEYKSTGDWRDKDRAVLTFSGGEEHYIEDENVYREAVAHFVDCVSARKPTDVPAADGLRGVKLVSAILRSAAEDGRSVVMESSL